MEDLNEVLDAFLHQLSEELDKKLLWLEIKILTRQKLFLSMDKAAVYLSIRKATMYQLTSENLISFYFFLDLSEIT